MDEEIMFNLEDLDIKEESLNILDQPKPQEQEKVTTEQEEIETPVVEEIEKTEDKETPSSDTDNSSHSTLYTLAKHLKEEGVLYLDEDIEKVETLADLKELIKKSNQAARYANLNEAQKRYQEALEKGVPIKEYENIEKQIETFSKIKPEDIEKNDTLRYEINVLDLMEKGLDREKAFKLAKLAIQDEGNVEEAKEMLKGLVESKKAKYKELIESSEKQTELALKDIKEAIYSKKQLLEMPLNDITKNKLFDLMTTKVETSDDGKPLNKFQKWQKDNPIEANIFMNYMFLMTNEGKDLGLIKKSSTSTASQELEKKLKSMSFDEHGSLIIPDEMLGGAKQRDSRIVSTNDLTINI